MKVKITVVNAEGVLMDAWPPMSIEEIRSVMFLYELKNRLKQLAGTYKTADVKVVFS